MIRVFIPVNWYWNDNFSYGWNQSANDGQGAWINGVGPQVSYRNYIKTIVEEAVKYGIYVDICPYQLVDVVDGGTNQGIPLANNWDSAGQSFLQTLKLSEPQFWRQFWRQIGDDLKTYPNVIFEAWNEPNDAQTMTPYRPAT